MNKIDKVSPIFDIIIVSYNARDKLRRCIESVRSYTNHWDYLITVVDNRSWDGTVRYLKSQKDINVIYNKKNLGKPKALNLGIKNTFRDFIVCLDDDSEVTEGWLNGLYAHLRDNPKVGIVGGKIVFPNKRIFCADLIFEVSIGYKEMDCGQRDYIKETEMVAGTCWLMRRELINRIGYFDERFSPNQYEDNDYCLRVRLAGYKIIYNGKVNIIHHHLYRDGGFKSKNLRRYLRKWNSLKASFSEDSHPADRHNARGIEYLKVKEYTQALSEFQKAAQIDRRLSLPFFMGIALEERGEYFKAIREFKKILRLQPENICLVFNIALCYRNLKRVKEENSWYQKSLDLISERLKEKNAGL